MHQISFTQQKHSYIESYIQAYWGQSEERTPEIWSKPLACKPILGLSKLFATQKLELGGHNPVIRKNLTKSCSTGLDSLAPLCKHAQWWVSMLSNWKYKTDSSSLHRVCDSATCWIKTYKLMRANQWTGYSARSYRFSIDQAIHSWNK